MALTQESVLSFLLERGGRVSNAELLSHFGGLILGGAPAARQHKRELFKTLVNSVAVVRQTDGVKFVAVKKRYQDFVVQEEDAPTLSPDMDNNNNKKKKNKKYTSRVKTHKTLQRSASNTTVQVLNIPGNQVGAVIAVTSPPKGSTPPEKRSHPLCDENEAPPNGAKMEKDEPNKGLRQGDGADCCGSVPLEPLAHEWLVKCAAGLWGHVHAMLLQDPRLAQKKDFMSGYTALHWAAKDGHGDMIRKLVEIPERRGAHVDVNTKAHGGYTPLHIAAIHGRSQVALLLVRRYGASVDERDNDGKKAHHYLGEGAPEELRTLLGGVQPSKHWEETDEEDNKEQAKGLNTISKLFQPHRKQKHATKFTHE
ncbi:ankyrin repeat domain-containing protein SOWAHA [Nerophis ophidion]|uniref:ankyrin repeat domain-containing protein SOWAHA n=1 Tax=Nerophis ophidion TaxID=159077 RepID=UPI002ADF4A4F|nr:ankyrin repeat domain-containing protein SOWAHA [Nerophis ophidion]